MVEFDKSRMNKKETLYSIYSKFILWRAIEIHFKTACKLKLTFFEARL